MTSPRVPEDPFPTPPKEERPGGSWPRRIEEQVKEIREEHQATAQKVSEIHTALIGTYERRGLIREVEDLKADKEGRKGLVFLIIGATVTSIVSAVFSWISGGGHTPK